MRVFLDANVLFSASRSDGAIRALLQQLEQLGHAMVIDAYVLEEARRNLAAKGPAGSLEVLDALQARMELVPMRTAPAELLRALDWLHAKDQPVLVSAIQARCDVLVTGDRTHFGERFGTEVSGVTICSPTQLYLRLQESPSP
jgi:uncharacterized protein